MNEDYFCFFLKAKMEIFLNYEGAGSDMEVQEESL